MKKIYLLGSIIVLFGILFPSCEDADYGTKGNSIYITEAATDKKSAILSFDDGVDVTVNVRLADISDQDVEVKLTLNPDALAKYNKENASEYFMIPDFKLPTTASVLIPAGEIAGTYTFHVDEFATNNKTYAIPVALGEITKGNVEMSQSQSSYIYILAIPLKVSVPVVKGTGGDQANRWKARPDADWGLVVTQFTLEAWARMSGYNKNNQAFFDVGSNVAGRGDNNTYIRFGNANKPYNYVHVNAWGNKFLTASDLKAGQWYHWAFVYDGEYMTIFRDGNPIVKQQMTTPGGGNILFNSFGMISSGATYFIDQCGLSQVRFWKTALSQAQIQNGMFYPVNPDNPVLEAYWPMDEGEGIEFRDITGNGHDAYLTDPKMLIRWDHDIRFDK